MNSFPPNNGATGVDSAMDSTEDDRPLSEVVALSSVIPANGHSAEDPALKGCKEVTAYAAPNDKEEGELSPHGDSEEDTGVEHLDGTSKIFPSTNNHHERIDVDEKKMLNFS